MLEAKMISNESESAMMHGDGKTSTMTTYASRFELPKALALTATMMAVLMTLMAVLLFLPGSARAAENSVGSTFTIDGVTYSITTAASNEENGEVSISSGSEASGDLIFGTVGQEVDGTWFYYDVTKVASSAFRGNEAISSVTFTVNMNVSDAIGSYAFQNCTGLESVTFPQKLAGIGSRAFSGCTSLVSVVFPDGAEIFYSGSYRSAAIGSYAFSGCTALESISIPAIPSATRFGDYYYSWDYYTPGVECITANSSTLYVSGFSGYWGDGGGPMARSGISDYAFADCTSLKTIVFEAGADMGSFAYFYNGSTALSGCTSLEALVFKSEQAYVVNVNTAMNNAQYKNILASFEQEVSVYLAVDYYATDSLADVEADDARASGRLARVEVLRGTSVGLLQAGDAEGLVDYLYPEASAYAEFEADGKVPDPNEVAEELGYDTTIDWAWKLTGSQSQRSGLTESCSAYLVPANDISAGRIASDVLTAFQRRCDENYSRCIVDGVEQDSTFDAERYYSETSSAYNFTSDVAASSGGVIYYADDHWLDLTSAGEAGLLSSIEVQAADGTALDAEDFSISYRIYDQDSGGLSEALTFERAYSILGSSGGPLLLTIEPAEDSDYSGTLEVWILVRGNAGSVKEMFTASSSGSGATWRSATNEAESIVSSGQYSSAPYAVLVGSGDLASALVGVGFAGLVDGPLNVDSSDSEAYGFSLYTSFGSGSAAVSGEAASTFASDGDAASFSAKSYLAFESGDASGARFQVGAPADKFPWGSVALLLDQGALEEIAASAAAYAYAASAPVFYLDEDGTVTDEVLGCLTDFDTVVLMGYSETFGDELVSELEEALSGAQVDTSLLASEINASEYSRDVADALMSAGLADPSVVTISDATDPFDAIGALNRSGYYGGLTLVSSSSADSKLISLYLRDMRDDVVTVRLYGREVGNALTEGFDLYGSLVNLWDELGAYEEPAVAAGDTLEINGYLFDVGDGGGTEDDPFSITFSVTLWGSGSVEAGVHEFSGLYYELAESVVAQEGDDANDDGSSDDGSVDEGSSDDGSGDGASSDDGSGDGSSLDEGSAGINLGSIGTEGNGSDSSTDWSTVLKDAWESAEQVVKSAVSSSAGAATTSGSGGNSSEAQSSSGDSGSDAGNSAYDDTTALASASTSGGSSSAASSRTGSRASTVSSSTSSGSDDSSSSLEGGSVVDVGNITDYEETDDTDNAGVDESLLDDAEEQSSVEMPAYLVGIIVAVVVAAVGAALWYLLRRRNSDDPLDDEIDSIFDDGPGDEE